MESSDLVLSANLAARKARHKRVFTGTKTLIALLPSFGTTKDASETKSPRRVSSVSASTKLFRSYSVAVIALLLIGAVNPENVYSQSTRYSSTLDGVQDYYDGGSLMTNEDGYIPKINPQTELGDRTTTNGKLVHEVVSGETISTIAEEYGLKTNTVLWENGLGASSKLKIGQKLIIPPVDGVSHTVDKGESVTKLASLYGVDANAILRQNQLSADATLTAGQGLYIPGAKPLPVRNDLSRTGTSTRINAAGTKINVGSNQLVTGSTIGSESDAKPVGGKMMIFPTVGTITQGFHAGHYAFDIGNRSKPPIWAAADGVVIKASSGTWGGGYGNHVIIDNGNGIKTLYAHMEYLSVAVGDHVTQGQVIGKMGRTGNVRGVTGIHLHFEVIVNGVKKVPSNYY